MIEKSSSDALAFECTSYDSELEINHVTTVEDVEAYKNNKDDEIKYQGPDFSTLDEKM